VGTNSTSESSNGSNLVERMILSTIDGNPAYRVAEDDGSAAAWAHAAAILTNVLHGVVVGLTEAPEAVESVMRYAAGAVVEAAALEEAQAVLEEAGA